MDMSYFQKINNTYQSKSRQETDLYLLNRHVDDCFDDTIDYHVVKRNGEPFELLIMKDTDGNTFKKKIKSKNSDPFNLGDYIEWQGQIWLVTLLDPNDKTYHSGYMYLCTVPLRWQNSEGKIIERWVYSEDFTKYSSGVTGNNTIIVGENQYGLTVPVDEETKKLRRDVRFAIDFDDATVPDIYALTNRKMALNNDLYFNRGGTMIFTVSFVEFNKNTDKLVEMSDGRKVWICNYRDPHSSIPPVIDPSDPSEQPVPTNIIATISGNQDLKFGYTRKYEVTFANKDTGEPVDWNDVEFSWHIDEQYHIEQLVDGNKIVLSATDELTIGSSFILQCIVAETIVGQIEVRVVKGW